jgi:transposase
MTSTGYRCPLCDGGADDTSEPLPGTTNSKIIPGRSTNVTTPFEGVIWRFRTGGQWREMPQEFDAWSTVHNRFR